MARTRPDRHRHPRLDQNSAAARRTGQSRTEEAALPATAHRCADHPQRPQNLAAHRRNLALGRLTGANGPSLSRSYAYDIDFNRTSKTENGTTTTNYGYNPANQLTTVNGTSTYSYDANGNLTGGGGWALAYNTKDQTTSITKPGGSALSPLTYAGQDQTERTQAGPTSFVTSALGVASATTTASTVFYTRDANANLVSLRAPSARFYYLFDGLGSVIGLVNTSGAETNTYSYDPYGAQLSASETVANPWRYAAGQYDDTTALTKFGTRYYNPDLGRFTQRDPSGGDLPYAYAGDEPINHTDPTGKDFGDDFVGAGTYIGAGAAIGGLIGGIIGCVVGAILGVGFFSIPACAAIGGDFAFLGVLFGGIFGFGVYLTKQ